MKYTEAEQRELIERAIKMNTYVCGADNEVCGLSREALPFPCQTCERNKHWKEQENMKTLIGTVYNVRRKSATKSMSIGDYNTLNEAKAAMLEHYTTTPKRGKFEYIINEEKLYDIDGIKMRMFEISLSGGGAFYKCYTRSELDATI